MRRIARNPDWLNGFVAKFQDTSPNPENDGFLNCCAGCHASMVWDALIFSAKLMPSCFWSSAMTPNRFFAEGLPLCHFQN